VKRLIIVTVCVFTSCFILAQAFAAEEDEQQKVTRPSKAAKYSATRAPRQRRRANSVADKLSFLADANTVKSNLKEFKGLEQEVDGLSKSGEKMMREWTRGPAGEKANLAEAVHQQVIEELVLIRKLAVEEGADKTTAAIDGLLLARQERYGKVLDRMEAEKRRMRRYERRGRRGRTRSRSMRNRQLEEDMGMYQEEGMYRDRGRDSYQERDWGDRRSRRRSSRRDSRERDNNNTAY
jgi:hypothetical protein